MAHVGDLVWSSAENQPIYLGESVWTHNATFYLCRSLLFLESVEGTIWFLIRSGSESIFLI